MCAIGGGRATTSGEIEGREGGRDARTARGEESSRETGCATAGEGASGRGRVAHGVCAGVRDEMTGE
jgi:hypothetical protein